MHTHTNFDYPDFEKDYFTEAPNVKSASVTKAGLAPSQFFLTSHLPTYYKLNGHWQLPDFSSLNCVAVIENKKIIIKEFNDLEVGDEVVIGKKADGSEGIFQIRLDSNKTEKHLRSSEAANTNQYTKLYDLLEEIKRKKGKIAWVLGPAVVFDHDTRESFSKLADQGYVHALLGGNAIATHDLEAAYLNTALGQDIYTQKTMPLGHYNHLDLLNEVRSLGSIEAFVTKGHAKNGIMKIITEKQIPFVLSGSIRDDGPLPEVEADTMLAIRKSKDLLNQADLVICLATMLHSLSAAELASSYRKVDGKIKPIVFFSVDITASAVNKVLAQRNFYEAYGIVTNVQDFVVNLERHLIKGNKDYE